MSLAGTAASSKPLTSSAGILSSGVGTNNFDSRPVGVTVAAEGSNMSSPRTHSFASVGLHHRPLGAGLAFRTLSTSNSSSPPPSVMVRSGAQSDNLSASSGAPLMAAYQTVVPLSTQPVSVRGTVSGGGAYMGPYSRGSAGHSPPSAGAYQRVGLSPVVVTTGHSTSGTGASTTYDSLNPSTSPGSQARRPGQPYGFGLRAALSAPSGTVAASSSRFSALQQDGSARAAGDSQSPGGWSSFALTDNVSSAPADMFAGQGSPNEAGEANEHVSPESVTSESRVSTGLSETSVAETDTPAPNSRQLRLPSRRVSIRRRRNARNTDTGNSDSPQGVTTTQDDHSADNKPRESSRKRIKTTEVKELEKEKSNVPTKNAPSDDSSPVSCCICLEEPTKLELSKVNGCQHNFCFSCIETWADRENTCPLCKLRFTKIERVHKLPSTRKRRKPSEGSSTSPTGRRRSSKRVRNRDQRADTNGNNALQGLLASVESGTLPPPIAQLILSNVTGGLMTLRTGPGGSNQSASTRFPQVRPSGVIAASAIPIVSSAFSPRSGSNGNSDGGHQGFSFEVSETGRRGTGVGGHAASFSVSLRPSAASDSVGSGRGRSGNSQSGGTAASMAATSAALRRSIARMSQHQLMEPFDRSMAGNSETAGLDSFEVGGADTEEEEATAYEVGLENEDEFLDHEENYGSFLQRVRNLSSMRDAVLHRMGGVTEAGGTATRAPPRSYAVNNGDENAGESADNALEIEDSDNEGDVGGEEVVDLLEMVTGSS